MALPFVFANVTELDTPQLDAVFNALGALVVIPCTATGTNTLALTPAANCPTITAYANYSPVFAFVSPNSNTGSVTINVSGVGAKNVYKNNGQTALVANDFIVGNLYYVGYNSALNASAGGFVILNPGASSGSAGSVQGTLKSLVVTNTTAGTPDSQCIVTAGSVSVSDASSNFTTLLNVNVTISSGSSGANGLDTGSLAALTWYAIYVIYNPTTLTTAGLMSASFTSPTLPSGYTQYALVGAMLTDNNAAKRFMRILQKGRQAFYVVTSGTNTANLPIINSGASGSLTVPTWTASSISGIVPTAIASRIYGTLTNLNNTITNGAMLAPNNSYGSWVSASNPPPCGTPASGSVNAPEFCAFNFMLESTNIYYAAAASGAIALCSGYELNL